MKKVLIEPELMEDECHPILVSLYDIYLALVLAFGLGWEEEEEEEEAERSHLVMSKHQGLCSESQAMSMGGRVGLLCYLE